MSLWHADRDSNPEKRKVRNLPDFDPLPELDNLLDEFDSEKNLLKKNLKSTKVEHESLPKEKTTETNGFSLPSPDEEYLTEDENTFNELPPNEEVESKYVNNVEEIESYEDPKDNQEKEKEESNEDKDDEEDLYIEDDIENEFEDDTNLSDNGDFVDLSEENFEDGENDEDAFEDIEDEGLVDDEDFTDESLSEEDLEGQFGLIPTILDEEESEEEIPQEEISKKENKAKKEKPQKKESKGFKELDEERVKEFFMNIFSKLPKFKKEEKTPKEQASAVEKSENKGKIKKGLNKKILISIAVPIFVILILFTVYSFWAKGYVDIDKLAYSDEDNMKISLENLSQSEEGLNFTMKNNDDISKGFSFYVTFKQKATIPFTSSKIECESDIIDITSGAEITEQLRCSQPFEKGEQYKISNVESIEL